MWYGHTLYFYANILHSSFHKFSFGWSILGNIEGDLVRVYKLLLCPSIEKERDNFSDGRFKQVWKWWNSSNKSSKSKFYYHILPLTSVLSPVYKEKNDTLPTKTALVKRAILLNIIGRIDIDWNVNYFYRNLYFSR